MPQPRTARGTFPSPIGALHAAATEHGVCAIALPGHKPDEWLVRVARRVGGRAVEGNNAVLERLREELCQYFAGGLSQFETPLDLLWGTPFQRSVWAALRSIPCGQTRSYGWVAEAIGKPTAARAVGQAVGSNPIPILIPCHRVIASDGSLGGFGGGLACKTALLYTEGVIPDRADRIEPPSLHDCPRTRG
jgi:O-6-methylguanine DNA methyltransferase